MRTRTHRLIRVLLLAVAASSTLRAQREGYEGAEFQKRRLAWFEDQRAYPNAEIGRAHV